MHPIPLCGHSVLWHEQRYYFFSCSLNVPLSSSDCVVKLMAAPEGGRVHRGGGVMGIILAAKSYRGPSAEIKYRGGN